MAIVPMQRSGTRVEVVGAKRKKSGRPIVTVETEDENGTRITIGPDGETTINVGQNEQPSSGPDSNFDRNLAKDFDQNALDAIAMFLLDGIDADLQSRREWEETANRGADFLGVKLNDPSASVTADGTVYQGVATCLLESNIKLWSTARAELLPVGGPVKVRRDTSPNAVEDATPPTPGAPPSGIVSAFPSGGTNAPPKLDQDKLAQALENDLNHYLTVTDREYYFDFSKMLFSRALVGNQFRKVFRDPLLRRPVSRWVMAQNLIVSNDCAHLSGASRVTEQIRVQQGRMRRLQVMGHYLDVALVMPTAEATPTERKISEIEGIQATPQLPADFEHLVYESYAELGSTAVTNLIGDLSKLDRDENGKKPGYPLPYRISIDKDSRQVLEIRRNWKQGDADHKTKRTYVKYGFIPGLGFWDFGLIHIVGNPTQGATMLQRATVDSTLYANFPGGIYMKGAGSRQENTVLRPGPGQFVGMDAAGAAKASDIFAPMPYRQPSAEQLALGAKFEADVRRIAGVIELPIGEGRMGNTPVGTIMSYIEAISQVPGAVHKDDHIAQQEEFELLRELFAEDPASLWQGRRRPARRWQDSAELLEPELVPAADPNTPSQVHRLMKIQAGVSIGGLPQFEGIADNRKIFRKAATVIFGDDEDYEMPEATPQAPPPDPRIVAANIKAQSQQESDQSKLAVEDLKGQNKSTELATEAEQRALDREADNERSMLDLAGKAMQTHHDTANQMADRVVDHAHHKDDMANQQQQFAGQAFSAISNNGDGSDQTGGS